MARRERNNEGIPISQNKSIYIIFALFVFFLFTYILSLGFQGFVWVNRANSAFSFDSASLYYPEFHWLPWESIPTMLHYKLSWLLMFICFIMTALFTLNVYSQYMKKGYFDKERNFRYSEDGSYGTSGWAKIDEIIKDDIALVNNWKNTKGYILGQVTTKGDKIISINPKKMKGNNHIAIFGASGSGKSRAFARPYIIQAVEKKESLIVTDPKGELFEECAEFLRNNGYVVKIFNLVDPKYGDSWNCLNEIRNDELRAQVFADTIISNTASGKGGDSFWDNSEMNLLKALILRVHLGREFTDDMKNMGTVYDLLIKSTGEAGLDAFFDIRRMPPMPDGSMPPEAKAIPSYNIFKQAPDNTRGGIILGLGTRLQIFQNEVIKTITKYDDIDLTLPGKKPCAYFCIMSDQDATLNFLSSLFFSFLFIDLVRYADNNGGRCDVPVNFVLDEFPNIGRIADFEKKISTVRSRGLNITVIFQAISQLQNRYPQGVWSEILANCDTHLFLGCNDPDTAKFISDRAGDVTIKVNSMRQSRRTRISPLYNDGVAENFGEGKRKLLTIDEVLRMPNNECLIIFRGHKVLKAFKYDYSNHPRAKEFVKKRIKSYRSIETVTAEMIAEQRKIDFAGLDEDVVDNESAVELSIDSLVDAEEDLIPQLEDIEAFMNDYISDEIAEEKAAYAPKGTPINNTVESNLAANWKQLRAESQKPVNGLIEQNPMQTVQPNNKKNIVGDVYEGVEDKYDFGIEEDDDEVFAQTPKTSSKKNISGKTNDVSKIGKRTT